METRDPWGREVFWFLLLAGVLDRILLLAHFGTLYIGTDDAIIWSAAVHYGRGVFHEPYFYGQDYGPMMEAFLAAPFTRTGAPLRILMPTVTSVLAMLPYWSFAFWNRSHGRWTAACVFLAMPVLLPSEFGMMTTVTRGWVTGIGLLGFLPWADGAQRSWLRSLLVGLVSSLALLMNPNALPFVAAFVVRHLFQQRSFLRGTGYLALGATPAYAFHALAQAYCAAHPERVMNTLFDWRLEFHMEGIVEGLSRLDAHFAWLAPLAWPYGQLIGEGLVVLVFVATWYRHRESALALATAILIIVLSFGFGKTHDGILNVFLPWSRIFLALPLVCCWGVALLIGDAPSGPWSARTLVAITLCVMVFKTDRLPTVIGEQVSAQGPWASERPLAGLNDDLTHVRDICARHPVGLIMPFDRGTGIEAHYRAILYPALEPELPPTFLCGKEYRYWCREAFADSVVSDVLLLSGRTGLWDRKARSMATATDVSGDLPDRYLLLHGNTLTMDSLARFLLAP